MENGYAAPSKECDVIMKGGIASGIVYPAAILEMAKVYRLKSVGGTSAGAIAAGVTAAAEYARDSGGFDRLREINGQIADPTFVRRLFIPSRNTRALMEVASATFAGSPNTPALLRLPAKLGRLTFAALVHLTFPFLLGVILGYIVWLAALWAVSGVSPFAPGGLSALAALSYSGWRWLPMLILIGVGIAACCGLALYRMLMRTLPENFYGICIGHGDNAQPSKEGVLTDWLTYAINYAAGLDPLGSPLTVGQLRGKGVDLKMVTSNLSQERPYDLPFQDRRFMFKKSDMERLFPAKVVEHLWENAFGHKKDANGNVAEKPRVIPPEGYRFLPVAEDMPVVVMMRMSLSFPVLISAVPLYTVSKARHKTGAQLADTDAQRNWFSDGGLSSNFPIHFFDAWLPSRPTFGIKLTSGPAKVVVNTNNIAAEPEDSDSHGDDQPVQARGDVYLPRANQAPLPSVSPVDSMPGFFGAIWSTAQNYRDNTQSQLPSYRERIVQVRLEKTEGGLNLDMPDEVIKRVIEKGQQAGEVLRDEFNFEHHQWVRYQVLMAQLEVQVLDMLKLLEGAPPKIDLETLGNQQLSSQGTPNKFPYPRSKAWCEETLRIIQELQKLKSGWHPPDAFQNDCPRPKPVLRVTPDL